MKKIIYLIAVLTLAVSAFVISASAQTELPAIDEAEAAQFLGRWYMKEICSADSCLDMQQIGLTITYDINPDNTIVVTTADTPETTINTWYMENGKNYSVVELEPGKTFTSEFHVDENGLLVVVNDSGYITYTREEPAPAPAVSTEAVADAGTDNYAGTWYISGFMYENELIPASVLGLNTVINIDEKTFSMTDETGEHTAEYILEEGKIYAVFSGTDSKGNAYEEDMTAEYHDDGSLFVYFFPGTENETVTVFTREQNTADAAVLPDSAAADGQGGFDLGGLLQQVIGSGNLDINSLVGQLAGIEKVNGLIRRLTGDENADISSLISGLTSGDGTGLNISGILDNLTSGNSEGTGGFDLGGLLNMFGAGTGN